MTQEMTIDARGLACPGPVLKAKEAVDNTAPATLTILVDNEAAVENVTRFLGTRGYETEMRPDEGAFVLRACAGGDFESPRAVAATGPDPSASFGRTLVLIPSDRMGDGDDALGRKLMVSFISTLSEMKEELWRLVCVNSGVTLCTEGSPVLETLQEYERQGLTILVCGTCLTHFGLMEAKQVGQTTNMLDIVTAMQVANKVIRV